MTEIPDRFIEQAQAEKFEELMDGMLSGENPEWVATEVDRMLSSKVSRDIFAVEDMTLKDIITSIAEREAERMADAGDLDEQALEIAQGYAEDMASWKYQEAKDRRDERQHGL